MQWLKNSFMPRHIYHCVQNTDKDREWSVGEVNVRSRWMAGLIPRTATRILVNEVFKIMRRDSVAAVAQTDGLIIALGKYILACAK